MYIFWIIWDIFIPLQHEGLFRSKKLKHLIKIGTPQRKILIVFLYYVSVGALALTTFTLITRNNSKYISETLQYFECQKSGSNTTCSYDPNNSPTIAAISLSSIAFFPAVNLVYVVNFKAIKTFWKRIKSRMFGKTAMDLVTNSIVQKYQMYRKQ